MSYAADLDLPEGSVKTLKLRLRQGLLLLFQTRCYAQELQRDDWDFAVELSKLLTAGPNINDCRWLICKGYVEHANEITATEYLHRQFRATSLLSFSDRTCFVLTDVGTCLAAELARCDNLHYNELGCERVGSRETDSSDLRSATSGRCAAVDCIRTSTECDGDDAFVPSWDGERHQLRLCNLLVKEFKLNSPNQEAIVMAFEEEGWPPRIDDPLSHHPDLEPKRRLHDTIKSLNRNQKNRLIRFMGDGTGQAIRWELATRTQHSAPCSASVTSQETHSTTC